MAVKKKVVKAKKETDTGLESTLREIQTKFGEGAIMKLGDTPRVDIGTVPTGSLGLDYALGVGGMPKIGRAHV